MQIVQHVNERFGWRRVACADPEVRLWLVDVGSDPADLPATSLPLSHDEIERANRFHHAEDRARFMLTRAALRHLLGRGDRPRRRDARLFAGTKWKTSADW